MVKIPASAFFFSRKIGSFFLRGKSTPHFLLTQKRSAHQAALDGRRIFILKNGDSLPKGQCESAFILK